MAETALTDTSAAAAGPASAPATGWTQFASDWASDQRSFKSASWGKAMMWIFLLSDTFIFSCFLVVLHDGAHVDDGAVADPSEVFALDDRRRARSR